MQYTLRQALLKILGNNKSYLHYYRSIIRAYEKGFWRFDIRTLVRNMPMNISCSYYLSSKGYRRQFCQVVIDFTELKNQMEKYMNEYIYPMQELRKNKIIARKVWIKKYGFISRANQHCQASKYDCSKCINKSACDVAKKYTNNEPAIKKTTKIFELLYGNLQSGYFASQIIE